MFSFSIWPVNRDNKKWLFTTFFCLLSVIVFGQHDSLILKNGNVIVGEIKSMTNGVLTIETDYSKSDFTIEWSGIKEIYSKTRFLITLTNGQRINGNMRTDTVGAKVVIVDADQKQIETKLKDIVYLKSVKSSFLSRLDASVDIGLSLTKANNLRQYSSRMNLGYTADKWQLTLFYSDLRSKQDSVAETKRTEWGTTFKYFLQDDWFLNASPDLLSNTEQALKLRFTGKLGGGKYFVHTNKAYVGAGAGLSFNNESFTNSTPSRNSLEAYFGGEVNLFDLDNFSLLTNIYAYPSLTENGRWRTDFSLDTKYDLPLDFYFKLGGTLNYDNRPAVTGKETDYVLNFSVGWELD